MRSDANSKHLVLGFDTSAAHCAAALLHGDNIIVQRTDSMTRGQGEHLMPMLEDILRQTGCQWADLNALGVGVGPGNFTGIRIAVTAARGLALALNIPAIGVSSFEAAAIDRTGTFIVSVDAPRDELYIQRFTAAGPKPPQVINSAEFAPGIPHITCPASVDLAVAITRIAAHRQTKILPRPAPLYIKSADAAPPRDPGPKILA